jgi:filamentous hemagglutinin family protein
MRLVARKVSVGTLASLARRMAAGGAALALCAPLWAGPEGERVVSGTASIERMGSMTQITAGNNAMIEYNSFNIAAGETVRFIQPGATSRVFNQVVSLEPSTIAGRLEANGIVYLMNPAGVFFRQGAVVNVGEIYAGAGHMSRVDFLNGVNRFSGTGAVVNEGVINANRAVLVGNTVLNAGTINTPAGVTVLASGDDIYVGEYGGRIFARVSGANAQNPGTGVEQRGTVNAAGGRAILAAGDLYSGAIWHRGTTKAADVTVQGGSASRVKVEGTIDASNAAGAGGRVDVTAGDVRVERASIDASGSTAGGSVRVGGSYLGTGDLPNAQRTVVDRSTIKADGGTSGGQVVVWSDGLTGVARSTVTATGGSGAGGLIETSGKQFLDIRGVTARTRGATSSGLWLLDPSDVDIVSGAGDLIPGAGGTYNPTSDLTLIDVDSLATALGAGNSVTITTNRAPTSGTPAGNITLTANLNVDFATNAGVTPTLTLQAANNITINGNIATFADGSVTNSFLNLVFSANDPAGSETAAASGAGSVALNGEIQTLGGSVSVQMGANSTGGVQMGAGSLINTARVQEADGGGSVSIVSIAQTAGAIQISGPITTQGGAVTIGNANQTQIIQVQAGGAVDSSRSAATGGAITINSQQLQVAGPLTTRSALVTLGRANSTLVQLQSGGSVTTNGGGLTINAGAGSNVQVSGAVSTAGGNVQIGGVTISTSAAGTINSGSGTVSIGTDGIATNVTVGGAITTSNAAVNILTAGSGVVGLNSAIRTGGANVTVGSGTNTGAMTLANSGSLGASGDRVGAVSLQGGAVTLNGGIFADSTVGITASTSLTQGGAAGVTGEVDTTGDTVTYTLNGAATYTLNATGRIRTAGGDVVLGQLTTSTGAFNLNAGSIIDTTGGAAGNGAVTVRSGPLTVSNSITTNGAAVTLAPNGTAPLTVNGTTSILTSGGNLLLGNGTGTMGSTTVNAGATLGSAGNRLGQTEVYGAAIQLNAPLFVGNSAVTVGNVAATSVTIGGAINTSGGTVTIMPAGSAPVALNAGITTAGGNINIGHAGFQQAITLNSGSGLSAGAGAIALLSDAASSNSILTIAESVLGASLNAQAFGVVLQLGPGKSVSTTGNQSYAFSSVAGNAASGGLLLTLNGLLESTGGAGVIQFSRTNDGIIRGATRHLTVNAGTGTVTFNAPVGQGATTLGQLSVTGSTINLGGSVSTANSGSATGVQLYTGNVVLTGSNQSLSAQVAAAGTTAIDITGTVNAQAAGSQSLSVISNGVTRFQSAIGNTGALNSFTTNAGGTTRLAGNLFAGTVTIGDALELVGNVVVFSTLNGATNNNGAVGFQTIDSAAGGPFSLTVNTGGVTTFGGAVGSTGVLSGLSTDATGTSILNGGTFDFASGAVVNISDPATLGANTTITIASTAAPTTSLINFAQTIAGGTNSLTLNATGTGGQITIGGDATGLSTFSSAGGQFGSFRSITTSGAQTFTDGETRLNGTYTITGSAAFGVTNAAVLFGNTTVDNSANNGSITFFSTVDTNTGGPFGLTVNTAGQKIFGGAVGGGVNGGLASLTSTGAGTLELRRDVRTTGNQSYADGTISLGSAGNNIRLSTTNNGSIDFSNAASAITLLSNLTVDLNGSGTGNFAGTITGTSFGVSASAGVAGGLTFGNTVDVRDFTTGGNGTVSLRNVTVAADSSAFIILNGTGTKTLNGTYNAGGTFTVVGATSLGGNTQVNLHSAAGSRNAAFVGTVDGAFTLTVNTPGGTDFQGLIGGLTPLTGLTTDNPGSTAAIGAVANGNIALSGSTGVSLSGTYNTAGAPNGTFNATGPVTLTGDTTVTTGSGDINFNGTVNGAFALTANSTGATTFGDNVGTLTDGTDGTALATLSTNAGGTTALPAFVRTSNGITFGDIVILSVAANHTVDAGAGNLTFGPDIRATGAFGLTGRSSGTITFNTVGGNAQPLNFLATAGGPTLTILNGNIDLVNNAVLGGAIRLDSNVIFTSTVGRWNGPTGQSINASTAGGQSLTINGNLSTEIGSVGASTALSSLTINSSATNFRGSGASGVTVRTTGNQSYSGAVTVIGPTAATNFDHTFTASGVGATISFGGVLGAGNENDTQAVIIGGGTPTFNGFATGPGAPFRLRNVTFTSELFITGDTVLDFGVTPVTFAAITGTGGGTPHNLTINTSGLTRLTGAFTQIDNFTAGGGGMTCIETSLTIAGDFTFGSLGTPEDLCIGGSVPGGITLTYVGMDVFGATSSAASPAGPRNLTLNSGAALTRFRGSLGVGAADQRLADVTSNAAGSFRADSGSNLTGTLTLNDTGDTFLGGTFNLSGMTVAGQVTLSGATVLNSGSGTINWSNAGDVTGNSFALTINNTGTATFAGRILSVASLLSDEGGTINLNGANSVAGNLTIRDSIVNLTGNYGAGNSNIIISRNSDATLTQVNIGGTVSLATTNAGAITVNANVGNTGANAVLQVDGGVTAATSIGGNVTGLQSIRFRGLTASARSITVDGTGAGNTISFEATVTSTLNGTYTTNGDNFRVTGPALVGGNTTVSVGGGTATFSGTVDSTPGNAFDLAVDSTNATGIIFASTVGATDRLRDLTTTGVGGQTSLTGNVSVTRAVSIGHNLRLAANTIINSSGAAVDSPNITISGAINADAAGNNRTLQITSDGTINLGVVGDTQALSALTTAGAGNLNLNGNVTTRGSQTYGNAGVITLGGTSYSTDDNGASGGIDLGNVFNLGSIRLANSVVLNTGGGAGGVQFFVPVNADDAANARSLTVTSAGNTQVYRDIGTGANGALESLTIDGGGSLFLFGSITTNGAQTYADDIFVSGDRTLTVNANGANPNALIAFNFANRPINGTIGGGSLTTQNGRVQLNGATILFDTLNLGRVNFAGSTLELNADQTFTFAAPNTASQFDLGAVTGLGGNRNLTINLPNGLSRLTGAFTNINNFTSDAGGITRIETDLSVVGAFDFFDAVQITGTGGVIRTLAAANATFRSTVDSVTDDGAGLIVNTTAGGFTDFRGLVGGSVFGSTTRLRSLSTNVDGTVSSVGVNATSSINFNESGGPPAATLTGNYRAFSFSAPGAVTLAGNTTIEVLGTGGTVLTLGTVDGAFALTTSTPNGGSPAVSQFGAIGQNTALQTVDITGRTLELTGNVTTTGLQVYTTQNALLGGSNYTVTGGAGTISISTVNLANNTVTLQTGGGNISVTGSIEADNAANTRNLIVNTTGVFSAGSIGTNRAVTSVTSNAGGSSTIGSITTTGGGAGIQLFDATVTLGGVYSTNGANFAVGDAGVDANVSNLVLNANSTITAGAGTIFVEGTTNSDSALTPRSLVATAAGLTTFGGSIGNSAVLSSFSTDGGGTTNFGGALLNTQNIDFSDNVNLTTAGTSVTMGGGAGGIRFRGTLDGAKQLTLNSSGDNRFDGVVGGNTRLINLATDGTGRTIIRANINTNATTGPAMVFSDAVRFEGTVELNDSQAENIRFLDIVAAFVGNPDVTISTGGTTEFLVGAFDLNSLTVTGNTLIDNGLGITTIGNQTYQGNFAVGNLLAGADYTLTTTSGTIRFQGNVGAASVHDVNALTISGGTVQFDTPAGINQPFRLEALTLNSSLNLVADTTFNLGTSAFTLGGVDGNNFSLTITTSGLTTVNGPFSTLNNFTTNGGGETCLENSLTIDGTFTFDDAVCLGGVVGGTITLRAENANQSVLFNNFLYSGTGGGRGLSVFNGSGTGETFFAQVAGVFSDGNPTRPLAALTIGSAGRTRFAPNAGVITTDVIGGPGGTIAINNAIVVTGQTALIYDGTAGAGLGAVTLGSTLRGVADGAGSLYISTSGDVLLSGAVGGGGLRLDELQVNNFISGTQASTVTVNGDISTIGALLLVGNTVTLNAANYTVAGTGTNPGASFEGAIVLGTDITVNAANSPITFGGTVDGAHTLNTVTSGITTFSGVVGGTTPLGAVTTAGTAANNGLLQILRSFTSTGALNFNQVIVNLNPNNIAGYTIQTGNAAISFGSSVGTVSVLNGSITIANTGNNDITFGGAIEGVAALQLNSAGVTTLTGAVGTINRLASLTTDAAGSLVIATSVATNGAQTYNDATVTIGVNPVDVVQLSTFDPDGNVSFTSAGPNGVVLLDTLSINSAAGVSFGGPVNGGFSLSASSAGGNSITFSATVGGIDRLQSISLVAGGTNADINLRNVSTIGTQTYNNIGGTPGFTRLNGSLDNTSNGPISFNGGVRLLVDSTVSSTGGAPISFNSTIDGNTAGGQSLGVNTSGSTNFRGNIGSTNRLNILNTDAGGTTFIGPTAGSAGISIRTTGNITFNDASQFLDVAGAAAPGPDYTLDASGVGSLVTFNGNTGASAANRVGLIIAGGSPFFNASTTSPFAFRAVTIQSALVLTANTVLEFGSAAVALNTVTGNGFDLTIDTSGLTTLNGPFDNLNNYTSLGGGMTCIEANLTVSGLMTFGTALTPEEVCIGGPSGGTIVLTSNGFLFTGDVSSKLGDDARSLETNAGLGNTDFAGTVGGTRALNNLTLLSSSQANFRRNVTVLNNLLVDNTVSVTQLAEAGTATSVTSVDGNVTFAQLVTLLDNVTVGADLNINFNSVLNGPGGLTVNNSDVTTFADGVGSGTGLAFLTVNANTINARYSITTSGGNITLNSDAFGGGGATNLGNNDGLVTINSNGGDISTTGPIILSDSVTFSAGAGSITFGAGSTIDADDSTTPRVLTLNSTGAVSATENIGGSTRLHGVVSDAGGTSSFRSIRTLNPDVGGTGITLLDNTVTLNGTYSTNTDYNSYTDVALGAAFQVGPNGGPNTAVILGGNTTVTTGDAAITFNSTVNGGFALALNSTGTTTLNGVLGGTTRLASLTTDAGGTTDIFTNTIRTTGAVTFGDALRMGSLLIINTDGTGAVTFNNTINTHPSLGTAQTLSVDNATVITVNGQIGDTSPLGQVILNGTSVVLNPHVTPGATGIINVTTVFDVPESPTLLARDLIITGGTGYIGFGGSLDSAPGTPRNLTINAPGGNSEVYFNWAAGPGIGTINPLQTLTVNNAGTIYLGWSPDYTGPVAINLVGGPAVVEGQVTAPPVGLFLGGNVLLGGDTTINAGNGRVIFGGTINSQTATARSLSVITNATSAAPVEFDRSRDITDATRLALFRGSRAAIIFGGSVGNTNPLNNFFVSYNGTGFDGRPTVPGLSTIFFANGFNSDGEFSTGAGGVDFNRLYEVRANRVTFGFNEKVTTFGRLDIAADRIDTGDITATDRIVLTSPDIRVRARTNTLGATFTNTRTLVFGFAVNNVPTEGTDESTSFVAANGINFSSAPSIRAQDFTTPATNPNPQFATRDGNNIVVNGGFISRSYFAGGGTQDQFISEFLDRDLNTAPGNPAVDTIVALPFSRRAQGPTNTNVSETVTPIIIVEVPQLNPPSTLGQALAEQLKELGLFVKYATPEELIEFLVGRSLYNDKPLSSEPSAEQRVTSAGRLSLDQVQRLLDTTGQIKVKADDFRGSLEESYKFYLEGLGEDGQFDPAAFSELLLGLPADSPAREAFRLLVEAFARVDQLGLGPNEARQVKEAIVNIVKPADMEVGQLYDTVMQSFAAPTPAGAPQASALP